MSKRKPKKQPLGEVIREKANRSLAILGMSFVWRGGGQFFNIHPIGDRLSHRKP